MLKYIWTCIRDQILGKTGLQRVLRTLDYLIPLFLIGFGLWAGAYLVALPSFCWLLAELRLASSEGLSNSRQTLIEQVLKSEKFYKGLVLEQKDPVAHWKVLERIREETGIYSPFQDSIRETMEKRQELQQKVDQEKNDA